MRKFARNAIIEFMWSSRKIVAIAVFLFGITSFVWCRVGARVLGQGSVTLHSAQRHQLSLKLDRAFENGRSKEAQTLLDKGANPNARDENGLPVIFIALRNGNSMVAPLLKRGADVNIRRLSNQATPLMYAAAFLNGATIQLLLKHGAKLEMKDSNGATALLHAVYSCGSCGCASNFETGQELIKQGAMINIRDKEGYTPLMRIAQEPDNDGIALTRLLLLRGARINLKNKSGKTALQIAQKAEQNEATSQFIQLLTNPPKR